MTLNVPGLDEDWECEHCRKVVKVRDTHLSWCLNIICRECAIKDEPELLAPECKLAP